MNMASLNIPFKTKQRKMSLSLRNDFLSFTPTCSTSFQAVMTGDRFELKVKQLKEEFHYIILRK
jgi:hypothetical protein